MRFALRIVPAPFFEQTRRIGDMMRQSLRQDRHRRRRSSTPISPAISRRSTRDRNFDMTSGVYAYRAATRRSRRRCSTAAARRPAFRSATSAAMPARTWTISCARPPRSSMPAKRTALYHRFQQLAMTDLPLIPFVEFPLVSVAEPPAAQSPRQSALGGHELGQHLAGRLIRRRLVQALPIVLIILVAQLPAAAARAGRRGGRLRGRPRRRRRCGADRRAARALGARPAGVGAARAVSVAHADARSRLPPISTTSRSAC